MRFFPLVVIACCLMAPPALGLESPENAAARILADSPSAQLEFDPATGAARLLTFPTPKRPVLDAAKSDRRATEALDRFATVFGVADADQQLDLISSIADSLGQTHTSFAQHHHGVPVFAAVLRVHEDVSRHLQAINGRFIPGIDLDPSPTVEPADARAASMVVVAKSHGVVDLDRLESSEPVLLVYHDGLARGVPGAVHLVWQMEIRDGGTIRDFVYIDAHTGSLVERVNAIHTLDRVIHRRVLGNTIWTEGSSLPYSGGTTPDENREVNELINTSADAFQFFSRLSDNSFRSWDGHDATMHSVQDLVSEECPNAFWDGSSTNFCEGMVSDDVAAHEWSHAYTGSTHGLIYQWQPGALNESTSDVFGELIDLVNGRGSDTPSTLRVPDSCSLVAGSSPTDLMIHSPEVLAGPMVAGGAAFNPLPPWSVQGLVERVDDGVGIRTDACETLDGFTAGRIALVDRGDCLFRDKVSRAQAAGAIAVIVLNNQGDSVLTMGGDGGRLAIPAVIVGQSDGQAIVDAAADGVEATLSQAPSTDRSLRWLIGEDTFGGAIRDMWRPSCFDDPEKVSDGRYACGDGDNGGVHTNSGVPNHAFALAVDGGNYNGTEVVAIGLTRAAHVWWRAMSVYQVPTSDFSDHADLIGLACADLIGVPLTDPTTGLTSADTVDAGSCTQVERAMEAVEMRSPPTQCAFVPLLQPNAPDLHFREVVFSEPFDDDPTSPERGWLVSNSGVYPEYVARDWTWTTDVPPGSFVDGAAFAIDSVLIGDCVPGRDDQSGVMHLDSPPVILPNPATDALLVVDHYAATEAGWDGGTVALSVNGGVFRNLQPTHFRFNPFNARLESGGNSNPLAGQWAFTGTDGGALKGSWGQSQIELGAFAGPGDTIQLRFSFGVDGCNGVDGWYLDRVLIAVEGHGPRRPVGRAAN